jgi:hypothetical protein
MAGHNGLVVIEMGEGTIQAGERRPAILTAPIVTPN